MGSGEESLKSLIREVFAFCTRIVNGFFSWVVAALPKEPLGRYGSMILGSKTA
jgi:hypothetical protein